MPRDDGDYPAGDKHCDSVSVANNMDVGGTYNPYTGQWAEDDYMGDINGYVHDKGNRDGDGYIVEVGFNIRQNDSDGDALGRGEIAQLHSPHRSSFINAVDVRSAHSPNKSGEPKKVFTPYTIINWPFKGVKGRRYTSSAEMRSVGRSSKRIQRIPYGNVPTVGGR